MVWDHYCDTAVAERRPHQKNPPIVAAASSSSSAPRVVRFIFLLTIPRLDMIYTTCRAKIDAGGISVVPDAKDLAEYTISQYLGYTCTSV